MTNMKELKFDKDSITITTTTTASDTDSDDGSSSSCLPASPTHHKSSSPQSLSSLSEEEIENNRRHCDNETDAIVPELDEEELILPHHHHCNVVNMYSYSPQHHHRQHRSKIRDVEDDDDEEDNILYRALPRFNNKKSKKLSKPSANFIFALVAVASFSLVLSAFTLSIYSPIMNFRTFNNVPLNEKQLILQDVFSQKVIDEQFTIRVHTSSSNKRNNLNLLMNSIDSHSVCPRVKQIQVDWNSLSSVDPPDTIVDHFSHKVVVVNSSVQSSSDVSSISTNAVLLISDDVVLTCNELDRAFTIWKQNPDRMVGFFPYHYQEQSNSPLSRFLMHIPFFKAPYKLIDIQKNNVPSYSVMSDRASFIHRLYLRTTLDSWMISSSPCRSIALSLKITSISRKSPMMVANSNPLQMQTSATMNKLNRNRHGRWLDSSSTCFSSIMKYLELQKLPIENRYFVDKTR